VSLEGASSRLLGAIKEMVLEAVKLKTAPVLGERGSSYRLRLPGRARRERVPIIKEEERREAWGRLGMHGEAWRRLGKPGGAWGRLETPGKAWKRLVRPGDAW